MGPIEAYIRQRAPLFGVDPDIAVRVAKSEGGLSNPTQQSTYVKNGRRERSYGPFQLYMDGGLGNRALAAGIDPRNPEHWQKGVDFALNEAGKKGWGQWYGAAKVGVGNWDGIRGGKGNDSLIGSANSPLADPAIAEFVTNNPQPGGYGPQVEGAVFGSMAPGGSGADTLSGGAGGGIGGMNPDEASAIGSLLGGDNRDKAWGHFAKAGAYLDSMTPEAPSVGGGGDARKTGNALLEALTGGTVADSLLKRRLGFIG